MLPTIDPVKFIPRFWTGTGSVISYHATKLSLSRNNWGLGYDLDGIHPGRPAAFFQWQVDPNECGRLKISNDGLEKKVNIIVGPWNDRSNDVIFKNQTLPVVITNPKGNVYGGAWNVVMVTFSNPVSTNYANLKAECTTESSITSGENATIEAGTLYDGTYKWYGNGSILSDHFSSYYNDRNAGNAFRGTVNWPFGAFVDVVQVKASTYKPVVFFQWQVDYNNCNQLTLRAYNSQWNERNPAVEIKTKWWSSPDSQARGVSTTLPYTVGTSDGQIQVIEVKFKNPVTEDLLIYAICPGIN